MGPFRPRRALGQAFLIHEPTADALVTALELESGDTVLEIGPGKGILTRRLLKQAQRVVAVEVDRRLVELLGSELGDHPGLELVCQDFMTYDLSGLGQIKVIGNLPYNISAQRLVRLLDLGEFWEQAILTCQREFAHRVLAVPGSKSYGALSVFLERVCRRERLFNIPATRFRPRPEIVSSAFRLTRREQPLFVPDDEVLFRQVVKAGFRQRRKTLANNLTAALGLVKEDANHILAKCGIDFRARAETLSVQEFHSLTEAVARLPGQPVWDSRSSR